jgi:16S rRNA (cytosine1402-N4)-methyltransferase
VSSHQIDAAARGFSFRPARRWTCAWTRRRAADGGGPAERAAGTELADVFYQYGEERRSRRLAAESCDAARAPFSTSDDLNAVPRSTVPHHGTQDRARIYQALRIAVNDELGVLERALEALRERLAPGGVFVVLSYHSLEDRLVKDAFREWSRACVCPPELPVCMCRGRALGETLTRKPVMAVAAEVEANPRSRSARLRAWRKAA